jgi:hypothetical protein
MLLNRIDRRGRFSYRDESSEVRGMDTDPNRTPDASREGEEKKKENGRRRRRRRRGAALKT